MGLFAARQPVFDPEKNVFGYELLFRSGLGKCLQGTNADRTAESGTAVADRAGSMGLAELTDGKKAFVPLPRDPQTRERLTRAANEGLAVCIPNDAEPEEDVLRICKRLKASGCLLVVNGSSPAQHNGPLLDLADVVQVDFSATAVDVRRAIGEKLATTGLVGLARNVGTAEGFDQALCWGYSCVHGPFFTRPVIRQGREIGPNKLIHLQVLHEVNKAELPLDALESLIKQDVSMTYRLLRFMNSAWFGLRYEVRSIRHALVLLGPQEVRKWASLLIVRSTGADKPKELLRRSLARARFAEVLAPLVGLSKHASALFLMGMFSCIDALLDAPMPAILKDLALAQDIRSALLGAAGPLRAVHDVVLAYESGDWGMFEMYAAALQLAEETVPDLFWQSLRWAHEALEVA